MRSTDAMVRELTAPPAPENSWQLTLIRGELTSQGCTCGSIGDVL
jgi:hypothetical protein